MKTFTRCLVLLLFLVSCDKDDDGKPVLAGVYDQDFIYHEFSPALKVDLKLDTLNNYYQGMDSLDINMDGSYDLIFSQRILSGQPNMPRINIDNYPYGRLGLKNGLEVFTQKECYPIGHGQTSEVNWVDTLQYQTRIDHLDQWSESNTIRFMWVVPPTIFFGSDGCWYNLVNKERYIGIRMKINSRYKYGWIKVNQASREEVSFISFALEN